MPSKSEELRLIVDAEMRLSGTPPLRDGEGLFIVTQGWRHTIARGMVKAHRSVLRPGGEDEFSVTLVGATITHEEV